MTCISRSSSRSSIRLSFHCVNPLLSLPHGLLIRKHSTIILCGFVLLPVLNLTHPHFSQGTYYMNPIQVLIRCPIWSTTGLLDMVHGMNRRRCKLPLSLHASLHCAKMICPIVSNSKTSSRSMSTTPARHSSTLQVETRTTSLKLLLRYDI